jgi:chromosomal replication initiation ATPase DnaA
MKLPTDNETANYLLGLLSKDNIDVIILRACNNHNITLSDLFSDSRKQELVRIRAEIASKARRKGYPLQDIGEALGKHHSTIMHYLEDYREPN